MAGEASKLKNYMAFKKKEPKEIKEEVKEVKKSEPVITVYEQNGKPYKKVTTQDGVVIAVERL